MGELELCICGVEHLNGHCICGMSPKTAGSGDVISLCGVVHMGELELCIMKMCCLKPPCQPTVWKIVIFELPTICVLSEGIFSQKINIAQ